MAKLLEKALGNKKASAFKHFFSRNFLPYLIHFLIKFILFTCRKNRHFENGIKSDEPMTFAIWHGDLALVVSSYVGYRGGTERVNAVISSHGDGEIVSKLVSIVGARTIRGSSSSNSVRVLAQGIRALKKGEDVCIVPDGPRGPRFSVADGVGIFAQKTDTKVVAMGYKASRYWQLKSWDKQKIPKPFCTIDFYYSEPFGLNGLTKEEANAKIKEKMMENAQV